RPLVLRTYAVATRTHDYMIMPGGLARVASDDGAEVTMQRGARSKDVWVVSNEAVAEVTLLRDAERPIVLSRGGSDLPSRAADDLYWLRRYAERAEGIARLTRVLGARLSEVADQSE